MNFVLCCFLYFLLNVVLQLKVNTIQAELDSLRDSSTHQKKRVVEMMTSLLKDLGDIGAVIGGNAAENKVVRFFLRIHFLGSFIK